MPQRPGDFGIEVVNGMAWLVRALEADETRATSARTTTEELHFQRLMPADALRIRGRHNAVNALSALALATRRRLRAGPMLYGLREYRGEPHRVEPVGVVHDVEYFDDSKGTNVGATVAALQGLGAERKLVVILGGDGKGQDFSPLAAPVARYARAAVLIGRDAPLIRAALESAGVPLLDAGVDGGGGAAGHPARPRRRRRADVAGLRQLRHVPQLPAPRRGVPRRGAGPRGRRGRAAGGQRMNARLQPHQRLVRRPVAPMAGRGPGAMPCADAATARATAATPVAGFDQALLWVTVALLAFGLVMVYSASIALPDNPKFARYAHTHFLMRHAIFTGAGVRGRAAGVPGADGDLGEGGALAVRRLAGAADRRC